MCIRDSVLNGNATWATIMPRLVTIAAVIIIAVMTYKKVKGSVLWGILGGTVLYYVLGITVPGFYNGFTENLSFNPFSAFGAWANESFLKVFTEDVYKRQICERADLIGAGAHTVDILRVK